MYFGPFCLSLLNLNLKYKRRRHCLCIIHLRLIQNLFTPCHEDRKKIPQVSVFGIGQSQFLSARDTKRVRS